MRKWKEFIFDAGAWGVASELASVILYVLGIITVTKWGASVGTLAMIAGSVPLFWLGAYFAWRKKATELEAEKSRNSKPEIVGRIEEANVRMTGVSTANGISTPNCDLVLKLSVTSRTNVDATLRDASLLVKVNGREYPGRRLQLGVGDFYQTRSGAMPARMTDLVASITYSNPIRQRVGSEGWLDFLVEGLDAASNAPVHADLIVTLTDELGDKHTVTAQDMLISHG